MATNVTIPNDEIKGKIIGKEGRNIRAFERAAGVELIVDDTPGTIVICPDDFYLFSLAETISDEGTFFLPAEATETQKVKAWIDTYQGKYPKIF